MSEHPYPAHVQTAVAQALYEFEGNPSGYDDAQEYYNDRTDAVLQALWDASRVDTVEQLTQMPDNYYIIDANGYWGDKSNYMQNDDPSEFPMRVIYWGDSDA